MRQRVVLRVYTSDMQRLTAPLLALLLTLGCDAKPTESEQDAAKPGSKSGDTKSGGAAKPVESAAPALKAARDAAGYTIEVDAHWQYRGDKEPDLLKARLRVTGEEPKKAVAFGMLVVDDATSDAKEKLAVYEGMQPGSDLSKELDYRDLGYPGTDAEGINFDIVFAHPERAVATLATLKGSVLMRVFGGEDKLAFDNLSASFGKPLQHPALTKGEVELHAKWDDEHKRLTLMQRGGVLGQIGDISLKNRDGSSASEESSTDTSGELPYFEFRVTGKEVFDTAQLKVSVYSGLELLRVQIDAKDITVPAPGN